MLSGLRAEWPEERRRAVEMALLAATGDLRARLEMVISDGEVETATRPA
jgi:hypothetical protein